MGYILNIREVRRNLNNIIQDVAAVGRTANELKKQLKAFSDDKELDGDGFNAAKEHVRNVYYKMLLIIIRECDNMKANVTSLRDRLDDEFELKRNRYDQDELETEMKQQKSDMNDLIKAYPEAATYYETTYGRLITKYERTIEGMNLRETSTASKCTDLKQRVKTLKNAIEHIQGSYSKLSKGDKWNPNTFKNITTEFDYLDIDALEDKFTDKYIEKAFDPVNMVTGCYIYNKSFLITEGIKPVLFELRYNSTDVAVSSLSEGWSHNHHIRLRETGTAAVLSLRGERNEKYEKKDGKYVAKDGSMARTLEKNADGSYTYTDENSNCYVIDDEGKCVKVTNKEGFSLLYGYEGDLLASVDTEFGTGYRFSYDEDSRLISVSDLAGRSIGIKYADGRLIEISDECGMSYRFEYDEDNKVQKVINARGTVNLINTYDLLGRVRKQEFPDSGSVSLSYNDDVKSISSIAQDGACAEYIHDDKSRSVETRFAKSSREFEYDDSNNLIWEKDRNGNETKYEYDERGNCTAEITVLGDRYEYEYDESGRQTKASLNGELVGVFEYGESGRLIVETDALGRSIKSEYDDRNLLKTLTLEDGSVIYYEHDAQGNISKLTDENGSEWHYTYDKLNRVTEAIDGNGNREIFEYNERSEITKMTNAAGDSRLYEYNESGKLTHSIDFDGYEEFAEYNELNKISKYIDKDGFSTVFEYDKRWRLSKTVDAEGGMRLYKYDGNDRLIFESDPRANITEYIRDENGNVIKLIDSDDSFIEYRYDALGRVTGVTYGDGTEEHTEYDALGNEIKFIDAAGNEWQSEYNLAGELTKIINPEGLETEYTYDLRGNLLSEETEGLITKYEYDKAGNITKRINPDGTEETYTYDANGNMTGRITGGVHFSFSYDCLDRLTEVKREGQTVRTFEYDKVGNRIAVTDALGNTTRYIRSKAGDILTAIDPLGHETHYSYDKCHRLIRIDQGEGRVTTYTRDKAGNVLTVTDALGNTESYEYDCNNNVTAKTDMDGNRTVITRNVYGDVAKLKYADSTEVEYSYDSLRRLKEVKDSLGITRIERDTLGRETKVTDHKGREVSYSYDRLGNRTGITYPGGKHVAYEFDKYGRNTKIKSDDVEADISYDAFGRIQERRSADLLTSYAYDKFGRLSELTHRRNSETIYSEQLSYDAEDNVLSDGKNHFEYDELGRLIKATEENGSSREYTYDAYGNRASLTENGDIVTYLYDEANQLLSTSDGMNFKYDKRGNVVEKSQNGDILNTYVYGANNRLEIAKNAKGDTALYRYNGLGFRVSRNAKGKYVDYILDQTIMYNNLLETDGEPLIWENDTLLFKGNNVQVLSRLGSDIGCTEFGLGVKNFASYRYDGISDTYFAQAREYMPEAGRFAGRDLLKGEAETPQSLNEYAYCHNNPIGFVDFNGMDETRPSGHEGEKERAIQSIKSLGVSEGANQLDLKANHDITERRINKEYGQKSSNLIKKRENLSNKGYSKKVKNIKKKELNRKIQNLEKEKVQNIEKNNIKYKNDALKKPKKLTPKTLKGIGKGSIVGGFIDVGLGMVDDYFEGASTSKTLSNAGVNFAFGFGESALIATATVFGGPLGFVIASAFVIGVEVFVNPREPFYDDANSLE